MGLFRYYEVTSGGSNNMNYEKILPVAKKYLDILSPYCNRIEIGGSIRRKKSQCKDIELIMIRDPSKIEQLEGVINNWEKVRGSIRGRYIQVRLPENVVADIFIAVDDGTNWGNIYLIRTGNWRFSRFMMGIRSKQVGYEHHGGYLWKDGDIRVDCYEEKDVFEVLKMNYIPPEEREFE